MDNEEPKNGKQSKNIVRANSTQLAILAAAFEKQNMVTGTQMNALSKETGLYVCVSSSHEMSLGYPSSCICRQDQERCLFISSASTRDSSSGSSSWSRLLTICCSNSTSKWIASWFGRQRAKARKKGGVAVKVEDTSSSKVVGAFFGRVKSAQLTRLPGIKRRNSGVQAGASRRTS